MGYSSSTSKETFPRIARVAGLLATVAALAGCATGKSVLTAEDVIDDGKRNTILFSYDMTLNVTDKYTRVVDTDVVFRCAEPNTLEKARECFRVNVPLKGRRDIDGYTYYTFTGTGAKVVQMPYGAFNLESVGHSVVVDVERYNDCFGIGFGRHSGFRAGIGFGGRFGRRGRFGFGGTSCLPVSAYITAQYDEATTTVIPIDVRPGAGCYAGHLTLVMTDGELTEYSLDRSVTLPDSTLVETLDPEIQDRVRSRVTQPCETG